MKSWEYKNALTGTVHVILSDPIHKRVKSFKVTFVKKWSYFWHKIDEILIITAQIKFDSNFKTFNIVQYSTVQYSTVQYNTVQYSTVHTIQLEFPTEFRIANQFVFVANCFLLRLLHKLHEKNICANIKKISSLLNIFNTYTLLFWVFVCLYPIN